jgi:hypothetical protein
MLSFVRNHKKGISTLLAAASGIPMALWLDQFVHASYFELFARYHAYLALFFGFVAVQNIIDRKVSSFDRARCIASVLHGGTMLLARNAGIADDRHIRGFFHEVQSRYCPTSFSLWRRRRYLVHTTHYAADPAIDTGPISLDDPEIKKHYFNVKAVDRREPVVGNILKSRTLPTGPQKPINPPPAAKGIISYPLLDAQNRPTGTVTFDSPRPFTEMNWGNKEGKIRQEAHVILSYVVESIRNADDD